MGLNREFLVNIILLVVINLLIKPLYLFGIDARVQNIVGTENFGLYFALFNFIFLFQVINDPGIQNFNSRFIAQDPDKIIFHFPRILGSKVLLGLIFIIITTLAGFLIGYDLSELKILALIAVNFFLATLFIYLRTNISALGMYRKDSYISAIDKLIMIIILGYLTWLYPDLESFTIYWFIYGQMIAYTIACIVAFAIVLPKVKESWIVFSWSYMLKLVKKSAPFALVILLVAIYLRIDGVMLERLLDDNGLQAGIYAAAYRFFEAAGMLAYLFGALLLPMYSALMSKKESVASLTLTSLKMILVISMTILVTLVVYRHDLMTFIYDDATTYYGKILIYMMLAFFAVAISHIYGAMIMAKGSLKELNIIFILGAILNVSLNLWLIPLKGAEGAAIATVATQLLVTISQIYLAHSQMKLQINYSLIAKSIVFGFLCTLSGILWHNSGLYWTISMALSILFCLGISLLLGVVDKNMLSTLQKQNAES